MKDTHEANLPTEENGKLEETKAPETTPENTAEEVVTNETTDAEVAAEETSEAEVKTDEVAAGEETVATTGKLSKEEILEKLTGLVGAAGRLLFLGRSGGRRDTQRGGSTQTGLLQNPPERSGRIEESIPHSRW